MDNLLKTPHEMLSAHSHLPSISSHRRAIFHTRKGGLNIGKNQSTEIYLSAAEEKYLAGWERKTCIALTSNFCCPLAIDLILIHSLAFPTNASITSKLDSSSGSRPQKPAHSISGSSLPSDIGFHYQSSLPDTGQACSIQTRPSLERPALPLPSWSWLPIVF